MPRRNGMGPMEQGPMTGRGMGWCGGRGGGWRHRHQYYATGLTGWQRAQMGWSGPNAAFPPALSKEQELAALKQQAESLEQTLGALKSRIQELDKPTPEAAGKEPR